METECFSLSSAATRFLIKSELEKFAHFRQTIPKKNKLKISFCHSHNISPATRVLRIFLGNKVCYAEKCFFSSAFVWQLIEKRGNRGKADFFRIQKKDRKTNSAPQKSRSSPKLSKSKVMFLFFFRARELRFFGFWSVEFKSVIDIALSEKAHL